MSDHAHHRHPFRLLHSLPPQLWLFANGINMEHTSDVVYEGKLIGETSYPQRAEKYTEVEVDGVKIDFYDPHNKVIRFLEENVNLILVSAISKVEA